MKVNVIINLLFLFLTIGFDGYGQKNPASSSPTTPLENYVNRIDSSFRLQSYQKTKTADGIYYEVSLISQTWQSIPWKHRLITYFPGTPKFPGTMLMVLRHLYNRDGDMGALKIVSDSTGTPAGILYDIPNQPLFDGMEEDDLQAYTFSQYLKTGDESWPLLFPMVKSVVRAMDMVQRLARKEQQGAVSGFVVTGHSKRGHASWLTAAADKRVIGIIPIAIDILNSKAQLPHHLEAFGEYSTPSVAATELLLELKQPKGDSLIKMVDAFTFREQLTLPKLIVSATNDNFFATDALNMYWDGLIKPKWLVYLPNANHVSAYSDARINLTAFAFVRSVAGHKSLPELNWQYIRNGNSIVLKVNSDTNAIGARVWISKSKNKDFRLSSWQSQPMTVKDEVGKSNGAKARKYSIEVSVVTEGYMAIFGEVEFSQDGHTFLLSTQTNISSMKE